MALGIDKSKTSVNNWITGRNKIDAVSLHQISEFLNVSLVYFFTDETLPDVASDVGLQWNNAEIEKLRESLREKDKIIEDLRFTIETMKLVLDLERRYKELNSGK